MTIAAFFRRYEVLLTIAGVGLTGVGVLIAVLESHGTTADKKIGAAVTQATTDQKQTDDNAGLRAQLEKDEMESAALVKEWRADQARTQRSLASMLTWMRMVSPKLGVPPPPDPARCGSDLCTDQSSGLFAADSP